MINQPRHCFFYEEEKYYECLSKIYIFVVILTNFQNTGITPVTWIAFEI